MLVNPRTPYLSICQPFFRCGVLFCLITFRQWQCFHISIKNVYVSIGDLIKKKISPNKSMFPMQVIQSMD